jgi:hypothetical protein
MTACDQLRSLCVLANRLPCLPTVAWELTPTGGTSSSLPKLVITVLVSVRLRAWTTMAKHATLRSALTLTVLFDLWDSQCVRAAATAGTLSSVRVAMARGSIPPRYRHGPP